VRKTTTSGGGEDRASAGRGDAGVLGWRRSAPGTPVEVVRGSRRVGMQRRRGIPTAEQLTGEGFLGKFGRCRGVGLRCWPLGASGWRGEAFAGDVVVRGATEWPVDGEAEASARRRKKGGGAGVSGVAGLGLGFWGLRKFLL
jgi:hypothetical protein